MLTLANERDTTLNREGNGAKTMENVEPKGLSLLVDYSKKKATIGDTKNSEALDKLIKNRPARSIPDAIDDALKLAEDDPLNKSLNLEDVQQVSFRLRKTSIRRCKSVDERTLSSYDQLQNSIRSTLFMQGEGENNEEEKAPINSSITNDDDAQKSPTPPKVNRRQMLSDARKKNQSMRNLSSHRSMSMRNLSVFSTPAVAASPLTSSSQHCRPIPRRIKVPPKVELSQSNHESLSVDRRASLVTISTKCTSCRNVMRRCKSQNDSSSKLTFEDKPISISLHGGSTHSPRRPPTTSLRGMRSHSTSSRRQMLTQSLSRRHLMESSISNLNASSSLAVDMDSSMIFATGPRIIRHGATTPSAQ